MSTTPKINAASGKVTGIDEETARKLFDKGAGATCMAIVEYRVKRPHGPDLDDNREVELLMIQSEAVYGDPETEDHLRNLQRRLYHERSARTDGETLPGTDGQAGDEPSVSELVAQGKMHEPHDYIQAPEGAEGQCCDRCGKPEFAKLHTTPAHIPADDPDPAADEEPTEDDEDTTLDDGTPNP